MKSYQKSKLTVAGLSPLNILGGLYGVGRQNTAPLELTPLVQQLDVDEFLSLLNGLDDDHSVPLSTVGNAMYLKPPSASEILRSWMDQWLASGKASDGDDPSRRNFEDAQSVGVAAYEYSKRGKIVLLGSGASLHPWIQPNDKTRSGRLRPLLGPSPSDRASEQLVFFLLSPVRFRLAKCSNESCGTYFLLNQWNRLYKRGTFCEDCKRNRSQESAKAATAKDRKDVKLALQIGVAKRFGKQISRNPLWYRDENLKSKIAEFLNAKFGDRELVRAAYPKGITGKWVANAKNWKPIEEAAKGGK